MTAPTSPKPHRTADLTVSKDPATTLDNGPADAGLRTALTKLADDLDARGSHGAARYVRSEIRALLAAHPAPETDAVHFSAYGSPTSSCGLTKPRDENGFTDRRALTTCAACRERFAPAPVSDTRREDVARALFEHDQKPWPDSVRTWQNIDPAMRAAHLARADAALAVLPAPPAVDEIPEDAPPYLVGVPEGMEWDGLNHDELVELGFDAGVLWGAWDARRRMPVVDEAEIEAAAITEARVRFRRQRMNVGTSQDREEQAFREGAVFAARLRGATRG